MKREGKPNNSLVNLSLIFLWFLGDICFGDKVLLIFEEEDMVSILYHIMFENSF